MNFQLEERRERGDIVTSFKFLNETDSVESKELLEISKERARRCHRKKTGIKLHHVKKYFYSNTVVDEWNMLSDETVNVDNIRKIQSVELSPHIVQVGNYK